jgi:beta-lactamase regulating signal transducer with metallopeptidase domain
MLADILTTLVRANLFTGVVIATILALRIPTRRYLGPHAAYLLWLAAPLAFISCLIPGAEAETDAAAAAAAAAATGPIIRALPPSVPMSAVAVVWLVGMAIATGLVILGQLRFLARARAGQAGPAVVGVICPRYVTPSDFGDTFSEPERALIRAHERAHIDRNDPKVNAAITAAQALCWFNPLIHLAAYYARLDQELACDATVMSGRSRQRRLYAQTMLKTQMASQPLPLGCHWIAAPHPLETRIALLKAPVVGDIRRLTGGWIAAGLAMAWGYAAWAAQPVSPPRPHFVQAIYTLPAATERAGWVMIRLSADQLAALPQPRTSAK